MNTSSSERSLVAVLDARRFEFVEEAAELAISCWRSVAEAAYRGEINVVELHCRQAAAVTREALAVAKQLGKPHESSAT